MLSNEIPTDDVPHAAGVAATTALVRDSPMAQVRELVSYLQDLRTVCEALCKATILPPLMQNPANLQLVIGQGLSMGFTVWQAIRASFIIPPKKDGEVPRVGYYVDSLIALVRSSGKCRFFRIEETTAERHRLICARTDEGTDEAPIIHMFELTRQQAHEAGMDIARWKDRDGRWQTGIKHNWETGPADMLNARNCGRGVKRVFQDVVFGMATPEELEDIVIADRQEGELFAAVPVAAKNAKHVIVDTVPGQSVAVVTHQVKDDAGDEENEPAPPPLGSLPGEEGSGDPAWDEWLAWLAKTTGLETAGWLPDDVIAAWQQKLGKTESKAQLTLLAPWMSNVGARISESKACSSVYAQMRELWQERDKAIRAQEREAKAAEKRGGVA